MMMTPNHNENKSTEHQMPEAVSVLSGEPWEKPFGMKENSPQNPHNKKYIEDNKQELRKEYEEDIMNSLYRHESNYGLLG